MRVSPDLVVRSAQSPGTVTPNDIKVAQSLVGKHRPRARVTQYVWNWDDPLESAKKALKKLDDDDERRERLGLA